MVTVTVLGTLPGVPQPVNKLRPTTLTASRSSICKVRRFLKPKKQSATANVAPPGSSGKERVRLAAFRPIPIVKADTAVGAPAVIDTEVGLRMQVSPGGTPEHVKLTLPVYPPSPVTV